MMDVPHIGFILAAYALTGAVLIGMVMAILLDKQALQHALDLLDPRRGGPASKPRAASRPVEPS